MYALAKEMFPYIINNVNKQCPEQHTNPLLLYKNTFASLSACSPSDYKQVPQTTSTETDSDTAVRNPECL